MDYYNCTCSQCEFCFPYGVDFVCAGGSRGEDEELYYKHYGDIIKRHELEELHYCEGFHQGMGYYFNIYLRVKE
jgi:hypothetical protein